MQKRAAAAVIVIAALAMSAVAGCSRGKTSRELDAGLARTYAELMLLHEREKMTARVSDSLYQVHVDSLLKAQGTSGGEFKQQSAELMKDEEAWRAFLADVSIVFDSLKLARLQHPVQRK